MYWIIQKSIFKPQNFELLLNALEKLDIPYSIVSIPAGTFDLVPDVSPEGRVYVCGAIKMARIAESRAWKPGSFLSQDFCFHKWKEMLNDELLNSDVKYGKFKDVEIPENSKFFIRPSEDNKAFDGTVLDAAMLNFWRNDISKRGLMELDVVVSSVKTIFREYRLFIVKSRIVTGSLYKMAEKPYLSLDIEYEAIRYVESVIRRWSPSESFVIDVALTEDGYKIVEFNNINSSGFYASDVFRYVQTIEEAYG